MLLEFQHWTKVKCLQETLNVAVQKTLISAISQTVDCSRCMISTMSTFCTDIFHLLWSSMQPQFEDHSKKKTWNPELNAHIVGCCGSSGGWHDFCTWLISCNSGHAFWEWLMHILGILEFPQHLNLTKTVNFNSLNYKIQQLAKDRDYRKWYTASERKCKLIKGRQPVCSYLFLLSFRSQPQHLWHWSVTLMNYWWCDSISEQTDLNRPVQEVWG